MGYISGLLKGKLGLLQDNLGLLFYYTSQRASVINHQFSALVYCRFRLREMEFPSAHRRLRLRNYVHLWISMDNICFSQLCTSVDNICFFLLTMG